MGSFSEQGQKGVTLTIRILKQDPALQNLPPYALNKSLGDRHDNPNGFCICYHFLLRVHSFWGDSVSFGLNSVLFRKFVV